MLIFFSLSSSFLVFLDYFISFRLHGGFERTHIHIAYIKYKCYVDSFSLYIPAYDVRISVWKNTLRFSFLFYSVIEQFWKSYFMAFLNGNYWFAISLPSFLFSFWISALNRGMRIIKPQTRCPISECVM